MIIQERFTFPVTYHGAPLWGPWARPISQKTWFGVKGSLSLVGALQTRECEVDATLTDHVSFFSLEVATEKMVNQLDEALKGTLNFGSSITYPRCLFLGWEPSAPAFYDGSGLHGWTQFGRLRWQQTR